MAPRRVLQVVGLLERGGIQNWLLQVARRIDRARFAFDFLVHQVEPGDYDGEVAAMGCKILPCPDHRQPWRYSRRFADLLRAHGPYDAIHSHVQHFNGMLMRLAARHRIPIRVSHSHNDLSVLPDQGGLVRRFYRERMQRWISRYATHRTACSSEAADDLFGPTWRTCHRSRLIRYGIDLERFRTPVEPAAQRRSLGLPPDARVIGHVGRFALQKNHAYLMQVLAATLARDPKLWAVLIGDGPLRPQMEATASALQIADRVIFAGGRDDVPALMLGAMDVLVLPSLHEGLPLTLLEAQAAGLPAVYATTITAETDVVAPLMERLSLESGPQAWADALIARLQAPRSVARTDALATLAASPFALDYSVGVLADLYAGAW